MQQQEYFNLIHSFHNITYQCLFLLLILIGSSKGGLEKNIVCRFPDQNTTVFWTGEFVSGNIECTNSDHKQLKFKSIDLQLIGVLAYKNVLYGGRNRPTTIAGGYKTFFNEKVNLNSSNIRDTFVLPYGNHTWSFRFFLNESLPPTLKQTKSSDSHIYYALQIVFVRPEWYKWNIKKIIPIVVRYVSLHVDTKTVFAEVQATNRNDLQIHVILQKPAVTIGNNVSFNVEIENPKKALINRILVIVAQHLVLGPATRRRVNLLNETLKTINQFKKSHLNETFQFHVPHTVPPTFSFNFPASARESPIIVYYELLFEVDVSGVFTNIRMRLPLIITDYPPNN